MKLFMIAKNNIKKTKVATATLVILIAITTIFLYVGSSVLADMSQFVETKNAETNGAHFIVITDKKYDADVKKICQSIDTFNYMEQEDAMITMSSKMQNTSINEKEFAMPSIFLNLNTARRIARANIIDEAATIPENGIVVPYVLKASGGYKTGDTLKITVDGKTVEFEVAGFSEDLIFANPSNVNAYKFFVCNQKFNEMLNGSEHFADKCTFNSVITNDIHSSETFESQYSNKMKTVMPDSANLYEPLNYSTMKVGISIFTSIEMAILVCFAIIILAIALIVIKFSTTTHIESNIKNIGAMEAMGYTTKQILNSIMLEYFMMAVTGYIIGILASFAIAPVVAGIISASIGLRWTNDINLLMILISLIVVMVSVILISYVSASKIKKITPLTALRNGVETHNFKKNNIPLEKTKLNLDTAVGLKMLLYNKKQNIIVGIIIMLLSFVCVFAFAMYYNFTVDNSEMIRLTGMENAEVQMSAQENAENIFNEIAAMPEVESLIKMNSVVTTIYYNGNDGACELLTVTKDYSQLQINTCIDGRMPENDNEISLSGVTIDKIGAKIGDTVSIEYDGKTREFLVVGITQHFNHLGRGAEITTQGMKKLAPSYEEKAALIHLKKNQDINEFVTKINTLYKNQNIKSLNWFEGINIMLNSFQTSVNMVVAGCMAITGFIIVFVMFLIIRVRISKERTRLGVSKALGFTSKQLISHIIISEMPVIFVTSVAGAILGYFATNPAMSLVLASSGILNCDFYVSISMVLIAPAFICILALITIVIVSMSIRRISPCEMFEEAKN